MQALQQSLNALQSNPLILALMILGLASLIVAIYLATQAKTLKARLAEQQRLLVESEQHQRLEQQQCLQAQAALDEVRAQLAATSQKLEQVNQVLSEAKIRLAEERAKSEQVKQLHELQIKNYQKSGEDLKKEFENLANKVFEHKTQQFNQLSETKLASTLAPFNEQLKDFKRRVDDVHHKETTQRQSLLQEISHLKQLNQQISQDAINLTNALKTDNKAQGNWGEVILERVLESSGLRKGHEYETQGSFKDEEGKRLRPDVVVHLPDGKDIVIDSKVSLSNYERYCAAEDEATKTAELKAHLTSLKNHIKGIAPKTYDNLVGVNSLDFILVFVPIEPAFLLAFEHDGDLFSDAYDKGIIIVSPTTLLAVMRTVQTLWRHERQNKNAEEIARLAGGLHDTIIRSLESAEDIGKHLDNAHKAQQTMLSRLGTGRGNLLRSAAKLADLGAKTKKQLPEKSLFNDNEDKQ